MKLPKTRSALHRKLEKQQGRSLTRAERDYVGSLEEGIKHASGLKAKVKVETLLAQALPRDLKDFRTVMNVTQVRAAALLGVSYEAWKKWETGRVKVPGPASRWIIAAKRKPSLVSGLLKELLPAA